MASVDKRGQLSSGLLASKGTTAPASRRGAALRLAGEPEAAPEEEPGPSDAAILYSKGDASASTFRPSYWTYERVPEESGATVTPISAVLGSKGAVETARDAVPKWYRHSGNIGVLAFGVVALFVSGALFVLSLSQRQTSSEVAAVLPTAPTPAVQPTTPAVPTLVAVAPEPPPPPAVAAAPISEPNPAPAAAAPLVESPPSAPAPAVEPPSPTSPPVSTAELQPADGAIAPTEDGVQNVDQLIARGDELRATGDFAAARLFYERAAEQGSASAARAVGESYDSSVLEEAHALGQRGDAQAAAKWYRQAIAGGDTQAALRLERLLAKKSAD
jgi:hypothetical protein